MLCIKPFFHDVAEMVGKDQHFFGLLVGYHTSLIITADIPFLSKLIKQSQQVGISLDRIQKGMLYSY